MSDEERTPAPGRPAAPAGEAQADAGASREEKMAAIRARVEALRAARGGAAVAPPAATPKAPEAPASPAAGAAPATTSPRAAPAAPRAAAAQIEVPVSSLNPGGRPGTPPGAPALEAFGTLNQSVEIRGEAGENENLKKILGGLGAYQNPLRGGAWQIDYRYYAEAKRRLEAAGYTLAERDYLGRPLAAWNPVARGWTRVEPG
ncbi:MAG: hypothetical protein QN125_07010 [Armatimonadota bacterium]|nr:hypothetical protein [Armatimonadota bacterium]MDR7453334.1 hypothetical protein [Armatimonadota bacterium]MDR7457020.1 hypothetical protein [Armatimonadota bacterium]